MVSQRSMEQKVHRTEDRLRGYTLQQLWADSEPAIGQKSSPSYEVKDGDISRAVAAITNLPSSSSVHWGHRQLKMPHHKLAPWRKEPLGNGNAPCAKTRRWRSLHSCKPADQPSSRKMFVFLLILERLGPYMSISCLKDVCTRTQLVHIRRQIKVEQPKKHKRPPKHNDPQIPPARLAFRQRKQGNSQQNKQDKQKGPEPEQSTHKSDLPRDTVV